MPCSINNDTVIVQGQDKGKNYGVENSILGFFPSLDSTQVLSHLGDTIPIQKTGFDRREKPISGGEIVSPKCPALKPRASSFHNKTPTQLE